MSTENPSFSEEPKYRKDGTYQLMSFLLSSNNLDSVREVMDLAIEKEPSAFKETFKTRVDILGEALDGTDAAVAEKRDYSKELKKLASELLEEFCSVIIDDSNIDEGSGLSIELKQDYKSDDNLNNPN